jgi:hypothetical protein
MKSQTQEKAMTKLLNIVTVGLGLASAVCGMCLLGMGLVACAAGPMVLTGLVAWQLFGDEDDGDDEGE